MQLHFMATPLGILGTLVRSIVEVIAGFDARMLARLRDTIGA
jgi:hypothetical protein